MTRTRPARPHAAAATRLAFVSALALAFVLGGATAAFALSRDAVLARGQQWVDAPVPYSQSKHHLGYRTDCSGYVSWCWATGTSWSTSSFHAVTRRIPTAQLKPGDALLKKGYHVRLFYGWLDDAHTEYVAYEAGTAVAICRIHSIADDLAFGYVPTRYNRISNSPKSANVLQNGAFNVWARSWGAAPEQPVWWQTNGGWGETLVVHRKDTYRSARGSLQLLNASDDPAAFTELWQSAPVVAGAEYRLSAWAKTTGDPSGLEVKLVYLDAAGQSIAETTTTGDRANVGGSAFAEMSALTSAPPDAVRALVSVRLAGGTTTDAAGAAVAGTSAILDDISLARPHVSAGIKVSAATARVGKTVWLSGSVTPTCAVGVPAVVYVQRPGTGWKQLSVAQVHASGDGAAWNARFKFTRGMRKGTYWFKTTVPPVDGYLGATTRVVGVKLK